MSAKYLLNERTVRELARDHAQLRADLRDVQNQVRRLTTRPANRPPMYVAKSDSNGVTAMSTDTPGQGLVTLYSLKDDGDVAAIGGLPTDGITVYNIASAAVEANTYLLVAPDHNGRLWVVVEDCGA